MTRDGGPATGKIECRPFAHVPGSLFSVRLGNFYLDPPSLVIREMHMQQVIFIPDHAIDKTFYFILGKEMAGNIQQSALFQEKRG